MRKKGEQVVQSHVEWRRQNEVRKLHIIMVVVAVFLVISVVAGCVLAWLQLKKVTKPRVQSQAPISSRDGSLPVYEDSFDLILVNPSNKIPEGYKIQLGEYDGVLVESRIIPALSKMMEAARQAGCPLKLTSGFVDEKTQDQDFQAEVKRLMQKQKLSQVLAENRAQASVGHGGYSERQTGLSVTFSAEDQKAGQNFNTTKQYHWLVSNSVTYGFILRFPEDPSSTTGISSKTGCYFDPSRFRYVGADNAVKMRELSMCLEEYVNYRTSQGTLG